MSWDDFRTAPPSTKVKEPLVRNTNYNHFYCIFRIGKKYKQTVGSKNLNMIKGFQKHMEREIKVTNADTKVENEIIIGDKNIYKNVENYIKDCKLKSNTIVARELLLTASPDFFKKLMVQDLEKWKEINFKFLKDNFGENCVYATLHKDEKTWHIHALIVPKFKNKKNESVLSNKRYFDGIQKFREWQDNYAQDMQNTFKNLNRGIKYSKAKHIDIKQFYTLINKDLDTKDIAQTIVKAKNSELLEIKIRAIQKTLEVYKNYNSKNDLEKQSAILESKNLIKEITLIKENHEAYKEAVSMISQQYKVPMYVINEAVKICEQINEKEL